MANRCFNAHGGRAAAGCASARMRCAFAFLVLVAASATLLPQRAVATVGSRSEAEQRDGEPSAWEPVQLVVYKSRRILALYRFGSFEKEYPVVLGLQPKGRKRHANDARTPEGLYRVVEKRRHERWQWFLAIDYPNDADRAAYETALREKKIPDERGKPMTIGGDVGIHGNDRDDDQKSANDWTKGCVALKKADIEELAPRVPVGTPVWIVE